MEFQIMLQSEPVLFWRAQGSNAATAMPMRLWKENAGKPCAGVHMCRGTLGLASNHPVFPLCKCVHRCSMNGLKSQGHTSFFPYDVSV